MVTENAESIVVNHFLVACPSSHDYVVPLRWSAKGFAVQNGSGILV